MKRPRLPGEISLSIGIILLSLAVSLMVHAGFGISTISSVPYALSHVTDLSFGAWNIIFQVSLLLILLAITRRFKTGYLASFVIAFIFGYVADFFMEALMGVPIDLSWRLFYFTIGYVMLCFAISFMVESRVPLMIADSFIVDLNRYFHITYRRMKTIFDVSCILIAIFVSLAFAGHLIGVGWGTVLLAIITGAGVHLTNIVVGRTFHIEAESKTLAGMVE
jgi:uncharacterized membrane protein YczE